MDLRERDPLVRAVLEDDELFRDIAQVAEGNILAVYRLQRNPRILAFGAEDAVWKIVATTRLTLLAREIREIEGTLAER